MKDRAKPKIRLSRRSQAGLSEIERHFLEHLLRELSPEEARLVTDSLDRAWLTKNSDQLREYHLLPGTRPIRPNYRSEIVAPICGCRYVCSDGQGLCELILRHGRLRALEFSNPISDLESVRVIEILAYEELNRRYQPIGPELLSLIPQDIQKWAQSQRERLEVTEPPTLRQLEDLEWRLSHELPRSMRDWFAHFASVRSRHLQIDLLAPRCYFREFNEFLICDSYQVATMITLREDRVDEGFLLTDQLEPKTTMVGDDFIKALEILGRSLVRLWIEGLAE